MIIYQTSEDCEKHETNRNVVSIFERKYDNHIMINDIRNIFVSNQLSSYVKLGTYFLRRDCSSNYKEELLLQCSISLVHR